LKVGRVKKQVLGFPGIDEAKTLVHQSFDCPLWHCVTFLKESIVFTGTCRPYAVKGCVSSQYVAATIITPMMAATLQKTHEAEFALSTIRFGGGAARFFTGS